MGLKALAVLILCGSSAPWAKKKPPSHLKKSYEEKDLVIVR